MNWKEFFIVFTDESVYSWIGSVVGCTILILFEIKENEDKQLLNPTLKVNYSIVTPILIIICGLAMGKGLGTPICAKWIDESWRLIVYIALGLTGYIICQVIILVSRKGKEQPIISLIVEQLINFLTRFKSDAGKTNS